jgi:gamma-glutamyltranspeptidase/glutathione hydrolase
MTRKPHPGGIRRRQSHPWQCLHLGLAIVLGFVCAPAEHFLHAKTNKPILHGRHWMAITGKPLAASAGAQIFAQGGNAIDATCAMLAASCTMHDALSWGGETQALVYHPIEKKVIGINALGVAPTGATADFFLARGMRYPPGEGPLAAVTPGTPGGLMVMLAEYGTMSLEQVLKPKTFFSRMKENITKHPDPEKSSASPS